jgi:hypothetical protein
MLIVSANTHCLEVQNNEKECAIMKILGTLLNLTLLAWLLALPPLTSVAAEEMFEEVSTEDMQYVRGLVSSVRLDEMQISIRPPKGKTLRINITPDTVLEGVSQIDEFEKEQQVKVWYRIDEGENNALKIIKLMELGC